MMIREFVAILFITSLTLLEAAKILCVFQAPALSHQIVFRSLTEELLRRHHEIDVVTADPMYSKGQTPPNMTEFDIHNATYNIWVKKYVADDVTTQLKIGLICLVDVIKNQLSSKEIQDLLGSGKSYDLIIGDAGIIPTVLFTHIFKAPMIAVRSAGIIASTCRYMGIPTHDLFYPHYLRNVPQDYFYDKYKSIYDGALWHDIEVGFEKKIEDNIRDLLPESPPLSELKNNVDMLMINMYPIWEGIRPYPPSSGTFKFPSIVGQEIPKEILSYLETSTSGIIYASFGTSVFSSLIPEHTLASIFRAFSAFPYNVLLKCDKDELPGRPKNVKLFKFLPQPDILKHPNIKLFITQGGQHSIDEAIEVGIPLVVLPSRLDQFVNSEKCVHYGIGVKLDIKTISEEILIDAIRTVIDDKRYRENIVKVRSLLQDNPVKSMDRLMWAIEHLIRHGGAKHMRSPSANMTWAEFFELELLLYFLTVIVILIAIITKLLLAIKRVVVRTINRNKRATKFE